ncbi:hypothetical protein [Vibrio phage LP.2]|nr:hypothetical protein [Vibrio phage LP.2]
MTSKSGKRNKRKARAARKYFDQNIKMKPRKQAKKNREKLYHNHTVEVPERLLQNMKQRQKEHGC